MLDHIGLTVSDFARSRAFYLQALAPLGCRIVMEVALEETGGRYQGAGFGDHKPYFWIGASGDGKAPTTPMHIAFAAGTRAQVDAFHAAALAAGGRDNGPPGLRPEDRKSTRLNSSHVKISYAVFCLKKKKRNRYRIECIAYQ